MLTKMNLCIIINEANKLNKIQSLKNHDLIIVNLILMNNFYFLDVVNVTRLILLADMIT